MEQRFQALDAGQRVVVWSQRIAECRSSSTAGSWKDSAMTLPRNNWLLEQLNLSQKKRFGQSSELAGEAVVEQLSFVFNAVAALMMSYRKVCRWKW